MQGSCVDVDPYLTQAGGIAAALVVFWLTVGVMARAPPKSAASAEPEASAVPQRQALLDNAKFLLIGPVVFTHAIYLLTTWDDGFMRLLRCHTTGFCVISGIVTREPCGEGAFRSLVFRLAAPLALYLVFLEPVLLRLPYPSPDDRVDWVAPYANSWLDCLVENTVHGHGGTWFLFALISWRVWAMAQSSLQSWARLPSAAAFSALCGCVTLSCFELNQAAQLFPIFVAGQLLPWDDLVARVPGSLASKAVGLAILLGISLLESTDAGYPFMAALPDPSYSWTGGCSVYNNLAYWVLGQCKVLVYMTKALVLVLFCCPRSPIPVVTTVGQYTMYPYLMHFATLTALRAAQQHHGLPKATAWSLVALQQVFGLLACYALAAALASPPARFMLGPFLEPRWLERFAGVPAATKSKSSNQAAARPDAAAAQAEVCP